MKASKPILRALCAMTFMLPLGMPAIAWANEDTTPLIDKVHSFRRFQSMNRGLAAIKR
jgi:hypothetical protein